MIPATILAATGHRPDKLGGYGTATNDRLVRLAYEFLRERKPEQVISGMAMGWDLAWTDAAIQLNIPVTAVVPFVRQTDFWNLYEKDRYQHILNRCTQRFFLNAFYNPQCYEQRNMWMCDRCHELIALWNGSPGGTGNCVKYANKIGLKVTNLWSEYDRLRTA